MMSQWLIFNSIEIRSLNLDCAVLLSQIGLCLI